MTFIQAYQHSINAVFCNVGKALGARRVLDEAKQFGFYSKPPVELPANEVARERPLQLRRSTASTTTPESSTRAASRSARNKLLVTPLQMALVAGAVANGGNVMEPHLVKQVTSPGGQHGGQGEAARSGAAR